MKAILFDADWDPKPEYILSERELKDRRSFNGSSVWRYPIIREVEIPEPKIEEDEVLIKVKAVGVCGSDTHLYEESDDGYIIFSGMVKAPVIIGHEYSGLVVKKGRRVKSLEEGDMVACEGMLYCGVCNICRRGHFNQCPHLEMVGFTSSGALADFIKTKEKYCYKLNGLKDIYKDERAVYELGALLEPTGCAYNGIFVSAGGYRPGGYAVVFGVGPIGLAAVSLFKATGASLIIAFDPSLERLRIAKDMGADHTFSPEELKEEGLSPADMIMKLTEGEGADIEVEAAGAAAITVPEIERSLAANGKMVYLGRADIRAPMFLDSIVTMANQISGARGHAGYGIYLNLIRLLKAKKLDLLRMVTSRFPFSRAIEAIERSCQRIDGKIMVLMD